MLVYLNYQFLENFLLLSDDSDEHYILKKFICDQSSANKLILDFDPIDLYDDPEKRVIARQIAQRLSSFTIDLTFTKSFNNKDFYESAIPKLFFMEEEETNPSTWGCFTISSSKYYQASLILLKDEKRLDTSQRDWSLLSDYQIPLNAMIISDNYLFSNDVNFENLKSIFKNLMPSKLKTTFDLTFIGFDPKKQFKSINDLHKKLSSYFAENFNYKVNLSIIREDNHERAIYTNYYRINSHNGFGLFKNRNIKSKDELTLQYTPIGAHSRSSSPYENYKSELEKIAKKTRVERMKDRESGTKKNRLLSQP
ncbi:hypothetical protein [uncultured Arcticibacterium sp.]|uniref:hypothetical protein n=1 Tax=uncultured Arcticibacterium sp. TaxID=2173042 RepID=UPI0030FBDD31